MTTLQRVRAYIVDTAYLSDPEALTDDTSLIEDGLVDSTGMLDVILFVESEFGLTVDDRETTPQNFETIARIAAFVDRKLAADRD